MKKIGIVVFLLGLTLTLFTTVNYLSKEKESIMNKIEPSRDKTDLAKWFSPITGIAIMGIGGVIFWQTYNEQ